MHIKLSSLVLCGLSFSSFVSAYDLHEWGTFTTVSGSDGKLLTGLHVEEESLPPFVYSHLGMRPQAHGVFNFPMAVNRIGNNVSHNRNQIYVIENGEKKLIPMSGFKGMPRASLKNVTVKMETPVIYFYGDDTPKVNVKVGFNGGTISQWYPQRKSGDTPNLIARGEGEMSDTLKKIVGDREMVMWKPVDFLEPYEGSIEWDVEIQPKTDGDAAMTFKPNENTTWIYPRVPDANVIKVGDEYEDYLFYRGVGNIEIPATFSVDDSETLQVKNNSKEAIPFAFAFENIGGKFRYKTLGVITAGDVARVSEEEWIEPSSMRGQQVEVFQEMRAGLIAQGLTSDEADGMVKTWWNSYFNKQGLRVFWVVPQTDLEEILPLNVEPKPENQVRVLVGRADVLRPRMEQQMIASLGTRGFSKFSSDRFYLPYKNRLESLIKEPVFQKFDKLNLQGISLMIYAKREESKEMSSQSSVVRLYDGQDVKVSDIKLAGPWKIIGDRRLKIGETVFNLDPNKGLLTAKAVEESGYDSYEIQLPKVLN